MATDQTMTPWRPPEPRRPRRPHRNRIQAASSQRGYDHHHRQLRARFLATYIPGITLCWRCQQPIDETDTRLIHLGHDDSDRRIYRGLEHAACNLSAGASSGNKQRTAGTPSRDW